MHDIAISSKNSVVAITVLRQRLHHRKHIDNHESMTITTATAATATATNSTVTLTMKPPAQPSSVVAVASSSPTMCVVLVRRDAPEVPALATFGARAFRPAGACGYHQQDYVLCRGPSAASLVAVGVGIGRAVLAMAVCRNRSSNLCVLTWL